MPDIAHTWIIRGYAHVTAYYIKDSDELSWTKDIDDALLYGSEEYAWSVITKIPRSRWIRNISVIPGPDLTLDVIKV